MLQTVGMALGETHIITSNRRDLKHDWFEINENIAKKVRIFY